MKSANNDVEAGGAELTCQIHRTRILIGLNTDETHERLPARTPTLLDDFRRIDFVDRFIKQLRGNLQVVP